MVISPRKRIGLFSGGVSRTESLCRRADGEQLPFGSLSLNHGLQYLSRQSAFRAFFRVFATIPANIRCALKIHLLSGASIAAIAASLAGAPAQAQTIGPFNWSGFYMGLNAGYASGRSSTNTTTDCNTATGGSAFIFCGAGLVGAANAQAVNAAGSGTINGDGFTGGFQAGYNWQIARFVYGIEGDFGAFNLQGARQGNGRFPLSSNFVNAGDPFTVSTSFSTSWLFTFRGRAGFTVSPNLLAYATGGVAATRIGFSSSFTDINSNISFPASSDVGSASTTQRLTGWVLGGGLEWALANHWTVKGEYLYVNFGSVNVGGTITNPGNCCYAQGISTSADLSAQIARLGVNYKF